MSRRDKNAARLAVAVVIIGGLAGLMLLALLILWMGLEVG